MSYQTILLDIADHVATITINRPEAMNSFTRTMVEEFDYWLGGSADEAMALVKPIAPERLRIIKEGFEKKDGG